MDTTATQLSCSDFSIGGSSADQPNPAGPITITPSPSDYTSGKITPGVYNIEIEGSLDNSNGGITDTTTV